MLLGKDLRRCHKCALHTVFAALYISAAATRVYRSRRRPEADGSSAHPISYRTVPQRPLFFALLSEKTADGDKTLQYSHFDNHLGFFFTRSFLDG